MTLIQGSDWLQRANDFVVDSLASRGVYLAVADDATAGALSIDSGQVNATGFLVQVYRAGVNVTADAAITLVAGVLTVADGAATYAVTAGDLVHWMVF